MIILFVWLVVLLAAFAFFCLQPRFPANTMLCNTDISYTFVWTAVSRIQEKIDGYSLNLSIDGVDHTFTAEDLSVSLNEEMLENLAKQMHSGSTVSENIAVLTMDLTPVTQLLNRTIPENRIEQKDYALVWDEENHVFVMTGGTAGEYNDINLAFKIVEQACCDLNSSASVNVEDYRVFFTDADKDAQAIAALEQANALISREIEYCYHLRNGDVSYERIDASTMGNWLVIGEDGLSLTWDQEKIHEYVQTMAQIYNIEGDGQFLTYDGVEIDLTVSLPTNLVDTQLLEEDILSSLINMESGEREVPYAVRTESTNYDGTYIEISIGEQKLRAYMDGELFALTDIVTGCLHCGRDTLTGVFKIENHGRNIFLQKDKYFVRYWMCFSVPKYGLHDADGWRTEYGGEIYKTDGSGGCVNVPREVIAEIYEAFDDGVPIIIYDDSYKMSEVTTDTKTA